MKSEVTVSDAKPNPEKEKEVEEAETVEAPEPAAPVSRVEAAMARVQAKLDAVAKLEEENKSSESVSEPKSARSAISEETSLAFSSEKDSSDDDSDEEFVTISEFNDFKTQMQK